jgi:hypothetical protein
MATINQILSLDVPGGFSRLAQLIDARGELPIDISDKDGMTKLLLLMIEHLDKITPALDNSDINFQTLLNNDNSLNSALTVTGTLDRGNGTFGAATTDVATMNVTMADTSYSVAVTFTSDPGALNTRFWVTGKSTTQFTVNVPASTSASYDWITYHL